MRERLTLQRVARAETPAGKSQIFIFDTEAPRLAVRITKGGSKSFIFETKLDRQTIRKTIGDCRAWTLEAARKEANRLQTLVDRGIDPREQEREKKAEKARKRAEEAAARTEAEEAQKFTLGVLLALYCGHLESRGKSRSAASARSAFKCHVPAEMAEQPAREIARAQVAEIIRRVLEAGKHRQAGILRAYIHAAYETALTAESDATAPAAFIPFKIEQNPARGVKAIPIKPGDRVLTAAELAAYLGHLDEARQIDRLLKVALLAGGQRLEMLMRARVSDYDPEARTLLLWDQKGKRTTPRAHLLPLADQAAALMAGQVAGAAPQDFIFRAANGGRVHATTPGKRVREIAGIMSGEPFDLRDIRRTCETHLAKIGTSQDIRAQLLSHGISGVQARHYDRHGYEAEKRAALVRWEAYLGNGLAAKPAKILPLRSAS